jgi:hypothetical protein
MALTTNASNSGTQYCIGAYTKCVAFFRGVLDIAQVSDHLTYELQDSDDGGSDAEQIHFTKVSSVYGDRSRASASNVV